LCWTRWDGVGIVRETSEHSTFKKTGGTAFARSLRRDKSTVALRASVFAEATTRPYFTKTLRRARRNRKKHVFLRNEPELFYSKNSMYSFELEWLIWRKFGLSNRVRLARNGIAWVEMFVTFALPAGLGATFSDLHPDGICIHYYSGKGTSVDPIMRWGVGKAIPSREFWSQAELLSYI